MSAHDIDDPVHPHACGEHNMLAAQQIIDAGSSPRVWGTPLEPQQLVVVRRFIPTRVGNTRRHLPGA